jgi:hypothetical protein
LVRRQPFPSAQHYRCGAVGRYPCCFTEYDDLINHPKERSDEYRKEALAGSILVPLLASWLAAFRDRRVLDRLTDLKTKDLKDCTLQLWLPDKQSEIHLYLDDEIHGTALADLELEGDGSELLKTIAEACDANEGFLALSAISSGYWPIVLAACRHYRLPVPPQFWISLLVPQNAAAPEGAD